MREAHERLRNAAALPHPLRDYAWLKLPNRVGAMDVDFMVERNGQFIVLEMKPDNVFPGTGQDIALSALALLPQFTVWLVQGPSPAGTYTIWDLKGKPTKLSDDSTLDDIDASVNAWFMQASKRRPRPVVDYEAKAKRRADAQEGAALDGINLQRGGAK